MPLYTVAFAVSVNGMVATKSFAEMPIESVATAPVAVQNSASKAVAAPVNTSDLPKIKATTRIPAPTRIPSPFSQTPFLNQALAAAQEPSQVRSGQAQIDPSRASIHFSPSAQAGEQPISGGSDPSGAATPSALSASPSGTSAPSANSALNPILTKKQRRQAIANSDTPFAPEGTLRRAMPAPYDSVFPGSEFIGTAGTLPIGVPDTDPVYPLEKEIYKACPMLKEARIKIYGWANPGWDYSTSHRSNIPLSYAVIPNRLEMDQLVLRFERTPDTVQTEHTDWGFRLSVLYGIDYRWTTAAGWFPASRELLSHNYVYGMDPVECYGMYYVPKVAKGMVLKVGRFISPPDIEAQLAPDNYLWTHSLMFTYDNYTQTGLLASIKLNEQWMLQTGFTSGPDIAPWSRAAIPTGLMHLRWVSKNNKDSFYGGCNSINDGHYRRADKQNGAHGHDNLQQFNLTWSHKFNNRVHMATEGYYIYQINALAGGTVNDGTPRPVFTAVGPGVFLHGLSQAWGVVNYTNFKITDKDYITLRPIDFLGDPRGQRTGFPTTYASWTLGWCHRFTPQLCIRPEIRYERALNRQNGVAVTPYDDGTKRYQFTIGADIIRRF